AGTARPAEEEQLQAGKRTVSRVTVEARTAVSEQRAEERIPLEEEHAKVTRRDANRPVQPGEDPFKERTVEVRETAEEPVVSKTARIVGEVEVGKEHKQHVETVGDTVRRTKVEVESNKDAAVRHDPAFRA